MPTIISRSAEETRELGKAWGRIAGSGWLVALSGDLGSGKTELVKGIAAGLGITERVHSPTFALVHEYGGGRLPLVHLDLYRLANAAAIFSAGLEEYLQGAPGVVVAEWIDRWAEGNLTLRELLRKREHRSRWVRMHELSLTERQIEYEDFGS